MGGRTHPPPTRWDSPDSPAHRDAEHPPDEEWAAAAGVRHPAAGGVEGDGGEGWRGEQQPEGRGAEAQRRRQAPNAGRGGRGAGVGLPSGVNESAFCDFRKTWLPKVNAEIS